MKKRKELDSNIRQGIQYHRLLKRNTKLNRLPAYQQPKVKLNAPFMILKTVTDPNSRVLAEYEQSHENHTRAKITCGKDTCILDT